MCEKKEEMPTGRLDVWLVQNGMASGREKAKELIAAGFVTVNGRPASKAAVSVRSGDTVVCAAPPPRYVGRGGFKLEKALTEAQLNLDGVCAMDVGASTGGFTDCMLQYGAARVYAVDVGHGQLHERLRADPRVVSLEGTDCRNSAALSAVMAGDSVAFAGIDVSFISLKAVLPALSSVLTETATVVCLIKPQFEAGRAAIGKNGVVKDRKAHEHVLREMLIFFTQQGYAVPWLSWSPITGGEGNIEYLAVLRRAQAPVPPLSAVQPLVGEAFRHLRG